MNRHPSIRRAVPSVDIAANGCWLWSGRTDSYGKPITAGADGKVVRVQHLAFENKHKRAPALNRVYTTCSPRCVNPDHLFETLADARLARLRAQLGQDKISNEANEQLDRELAGLTDDLTKGQTNEPVQDQSNGE